jgi:protoporphyrinogen oxidase
VQVFERAPSAGGLISTFDFAGARVEHFYHFLCLMDEGYFRLCAELGLQERIRFVETRTGFFFEGREYPFTTPPDLLRFSPVSLLDRLRLGVLALECRWRTDWRKLDEIDARSWLIGRIGRRAYEIIWHPLLALKFGELHDEISAAWVWHRIHRVSTSKGRSGYLEGGTQLLIDTLLEGLAGRGVEVLTDHAIKSVEVQDGRVTGLGFESGRSTTATWSSPRFRCRSSPTCCPRRSAATPNNSARWRTSASCARSSSSRGRSQATSGTTSTTRGRPSTDSSSTPT